MDVIDLLPAPPLLAAFSIASVVLAVTPGPGVFYIVTRVRAIRGARASAAMPSSAPPRSPPGRIFRDGFIVALLNPKTALFFAAFLPQFIRSDSSSVAQSALLGALFVLIAAATDTLYALAASAVARRLAAPAEVGRSNGRERLAAERWVRRSRYVAGAVFLGLGLYAALSGSRGTR
ncbi:MAG TPA: LysE family transporter [Gammaproteobacteria bacterium]|nr:LysE family transporter [Gammaproteobacteria bacterium]